MPRLKPRLSVPHNLIGWRERVSLPELGVGLIIAKVDTGAATAALHATDIRIAGSHVEFIVPVKGRHLHCSLPLKGEKRVKSSSGHSQSRALVETAVKIGRLRFIIDMTLTDRSDMGVPMLIGRSSIAGRYVVDPGRSFILSPKRRKPK
ncbi:MAG: ATP-dependent zinc protease family protein [Aestuariivirga sp.]